MVVIPVPPPSAMSTGRDGKGGEVADLVEREEQRWVKSCAGGGRSKVAGGLDEVLDEGCDERPRGASSGTGGQQVQRAVAGEKVSRVKALAGIGGDRIEDAWVREA